MSSYFKKVVKNGHDVVSMIICFYGHVIFSVIKFILYPKKVFLVRLVQNKRELIKIVSRDTFHLFLSPFLNVKLAFHLVI